MTTRLRDWGLLLGFGCGMWLLTSVIGIGLLAAIWWFFGEQAAIYTFIGMIFLRLMFSVAEVFMEGRSARCPECRAKVLTSRGVRCVCCGGAAQRKDGREP